MLNGLKNCQCTKSKGVNFNRVFFKVNTLNGLGSVLLGLKNMGVLLSGASVAVPVLGAACLGCERGVGVAGDEGCVFGRWEQQPKGAFWFCLRSRFPFLLNY